jgi:general stress protein 26
MKTTTQARDPAAFEKLQELVREIEVAMITTVIPDGALHSRPMVTCDIDEEGEMWFFTMDDSDMVHDLEAEHAVNVSYAEPTKHRYVSITGSASVVHNRGKAHELWDASLKPYFPRGLDDPHVVLLRVRIETAEFWDSPSSKVMRVFRRIGGGQSVDAEAGEHTKIDVRATPASG